MKELRRTRWMVCHGVYSMLSSSVAKHCSTLVNISLLTVKNGTKQVGTMHALFAIPQLQCVLSFNTVCDVVSLQSGTSHVINATNQVKRVTGAVSYRNVLHFAFYDCQCCDVAFAASIDTMVALCWLYRDL